MKARSIMASAALATLLLAAPASAQASGRFDGFEAVVVACVHQPGVPALRELCDGVQARVALAASRAGIRLLRAPANDLDARRARAGEADAVIMECELAIDDRRGERERQAIHARLSLVRHYDGAVEAGEAKDGDGPGAVPRAGTLELWAEDIIASGPAGQLPDAVAQAVGRLAGRGFDVYLRAGGAPASD